MTISTKAGSFAKKTSTGSQVITGLGFQPKAILFWAVGDTVDATWTSGISSSTGITTGASESYCIATYDSDAVTTTATSHDHVSAAIVFINYGSVLASAALTSFDSDGFTLNWTTANATAYLIHFLAIGGAGLTSAKAVSFNTTTGTVAVTGVGFRPDAVLHVGGGTTNTGVLTPAYQVLGAMDSAGHQWAISRYNGDGFTGAQVHAGRYQSTARCMVQPNFATSLNTQLSYLSMDVDGFSLTNNSNLSTLLIYSLCLKGDGFKVGSVAKPTGAATVSQVVTGMGFQPSGMIVANIGSTTTAAMTRDSAFSLGAASDASNRHATALTDFYGFSPIKARSYSSSSKIALKVDNSTPALDAAADLTSFDSDGFTLSWTTNDAVATPIYYLAMGSSSAVSATVAATTLIGAGVLAVPSVTATQTRTVTATVLTGSGVLAVPTAIPVQSATVSAAILAGTGLLSVPSVTATQTRTVVAPALAGSGILPISSISLVQSATIPAVALAGSGLLAAPLATNRTTAALLTGAVVALAPVISATQTRVVSATILTGSGAALSPLAVVSSNIAITAAALSGSGAIAAPAILTAQNITLAATVLSGSGVLDAPSTAISIAAALLAGTGLAQPPTIAAAQSRTLSAVLLTGSGVVNAPSITAIQNRTLLAAALTGSGLLRPSTAALKVATPALSGSGALRPSTITAIQNRTVAALLAMGSGALPMPRPLAFRHHTLSGSPFLSPVLTGSVIFSPVSDRDHLTLSPSMTGSLLLEPD